MVKWEDVVSSNLAYYARIISRYLVEKMHWDYAGVEDCLSKKRYRYPNAIQAKYFSIKGKYPIVSQSKDYVSGYSDDTSLVINDPLPIIIFGDHTREVKYINFPFIIGADGVKLLLPNENFIPKFFYYMIRGAEINSNKYARHFRLLRNQKVPAKVNSKHIQENIIIFLEDLENNAVKSKVYFDEETEKKIVSLQRISLLNRKLVEQNEKQEDKLIQLHQQVLHEGIEGKLTEKWRYEHPRLISGDNHAFKLLEKIKLEKDRLVKEGKLKKEKSSPAITEGEKPFALPEGWVWTRLGEVTNYGHMEKAKDIKDDTWVLDLEDIEKETSQLLQRVVFGDKNSLSMKNTFHKGYVLYGKLRPYLDKVIVAGEDGVATTELVPIKCYEGLDPNYLRLVLKTRFFIKYAMSKVSGMKMPRLRTKNAQLALIPLPPFREQEAIVEKVSKIMEMINELKKQILERKEQSEILMQSVLREAFNNSD